MAVLKKLFKYEICLWDIEGNALRGIPVLLIRKNGFTEIISFENECVVHEMGDKISKKLVRDAIFEWILQNSNELMEEFRIADSYSEEYVPKHNF